MSKKCQKHPIFKENVDDGRLHFPLLVSESLAFFGMGGGGKNGKSPKLARTVKGILDLRHFGSNLTTSLISTIKKLQNYM